jgi:S-adenosylmethionine:tRNA ribosyltransferase-isomerase
VKVSDFDFHLPPELIAQTAAPRGASRLLVLDRARGALRHLHVRDLPGVLSPGDLLVLNDTRVFPARLLGHRIPSGGAVECLLLSREHPVSNSQPPTSNLQPPTSNLQPPTSNQPPASAAPPTTAGKPTSRLRGSADYGGQANLQPPRDQLWSALMHPGQKLKPGARVEFRGPGGVLFAEVLERQFFGRRLIRLWTEDGSDVDAVVDAIGHIPLPPYIHRPDDASDRERYQTIFASARGSVAAPTAGLHFDAALLDALDRAGVRQTTITLHVGYGTFKPVRVENLEEHSVDPEPYVISEAAAGAIAAAIAERRRVVAVGTTTTRALEDAASRAGGGMRPGAATATLFIHPGYEFRVISGLLTNFHLPRSSLLMLVSAFAGRDHTLEAYREAVAQQYRFYSYGDAMLVV